MSAWEQHRADRLAQTNTLVELMPQDAVTGETKVMSFSLFPFSTSPLDNPPSTPYGQALVSVPSFDSSEVPLGTAATVLADTGEGEIVLGQNGGDLDEIFAPGRYRWSGRWARVLRGGYTPSTAHEMSLAEYAEVQLLKMGQPVAGLDQVRVPVREPARDFDRPLGYQRFRGTVGAIHLSELGEWVDFGGPAHLRALVGDLTLEAWVWPVESLDNRRILTWPGASSWPFHFFTKGPDGTLSFGRSGVSTVHSTLDLAPHQWHHLSVTCSGSEATLRVWTPASREERSETLDMGAGAVTAGDGDLALGRDSKGLAGMVEEVRIWSEARTARQIRRFRNRPLTTAEAQGAALVAYWPLDADASDLSAYANHGALVGGSFVSSLQGGEDSEDVSLPEAWGEPENCEAYLVDGPRQIYCVAAGAIVAVPAAYDSGASIDSGPVYSDLLDFLAIAPVPGTFSAFVAGPDGSYVRLGSQPSGVVTVDLQGYTARGFLLRSGSEIVRHMVTTRGPYPLVDPDDLDAPSFDTLHQVNPAPLGYFLAAGESATLLEAASAVLRTIGAYGWFEAALFRVERFEGVTGEASVAILDEGNIADPGLEPIDPDLRPWKVVLWYRRNHTLLTGAQLAGSLRGTDREVFLGRPYRRAAANDPEIREDYRLAAITMEFETHFTAREDALTEAERLLELFGGDGQAFVVPAVDEMARDIGRFRMVTLRYREGSVGGEVVERLSLGDGANFVVLGPGSREALAGEAVSLKLWRNIKGAA